MLIWSFQVLVGASGHVGFRFDECYQDEPDLVSIHLRSEICSLLMMILEIFVICAILLSEYKVIFRVKVATSNPMLVISERSSLTDCPHYVDHADYSELLRLYKRYAKNNELDTYL